MLSGEEAKIGWFPASHGTWVEQTTVDVAEGMLNSMTMGYAPDDESPSDQPFRLIGSLSRMISHQFSEGTTHDGQVTLLTPKARPEMLGVEIPPDYSSTSLLLWRLKQVPRTPLTGKNAAGPKVTAAREVATGNLGTASRASSARS